MKNVGRAWFVLAVLVSAALFGGCARDCGKERLCQALYSPYEALSSVVLESGERSITLQTHLSHTSEGVRMDILSPEPYDGISAESVCGENELLSLAYDGIRAELPKSDLESLGLVLTLLSDASVNALEAQPRTAFVPFEEASAQTLYQVTFVYDEGTYTAVYDVDTGIPLLLGLQTETSSVELHIEKFK